MQINNPHEEDTHWRTIITWTPDEFLPDQDTGAIMDSVDFIMGVTYRLCVETAGVEASLWHFEGE